VTEACTEAYGSAYCIVLLTRGPRSGSGIVGGPPGAMRAEAEL